MLLSLSACAGTGDTTIDSLSKRKVVLEPEQKVEVDRDVVASGYREFLEKAPEDENYREAMRRLADIELEAGQDQMAKGDGDASGSPVDSAIGLYSSYINNYPEQKSSDNALYQLAKAYDLKGDHKNALKTLDQLIQQYPNTTHRDEVQFRRGEILFVNKRFTDAGLAYEQVLRSGKKSRYYEKALYKYGWSLFKQSKRQDALVVFFKLLDYKLEQGKLRFDGPDPQLSRAEKEVLDDALRVVSLSFSYLDGPKSVIAYFREAGSRPYEALIYDNLGKLYLEKERIRDAADTYLAFAQRYPDDVRSPGFHTRAINAYKQGGFASLILPAKEDFVTLYGANSAFSRAHPEEARTEVRPLLMVHLRDLATHYHAVARKSKKPADFQKAANWYAQYLSTFPNEPSSPSINFLYAEVLNDAGRLAEAVAQYEKTAYQYPQHKQSAEAGYAALVGYQTLEKRAAAGDTQIRDMAIDSALQFGAKFPNDKRVPAVYARTAQELLDAKDYSRAIETSQKLVALPSINKYRNLKRSGLLVLGHAYFESGLYNDAEQAYIQVLKLYSPKQKQYAEVRERLAASVYKQGEERRENGAMAAAVNDFLRVGRVAPGSSVAATAQYDAGAALMTMQDWPRAANVLEDFRRRYPKNHKLQQGVTEKLAVVYGKTGSTSKAAREIETMAATHADPSIRMAMLWQSANMYKDTGRGNDALRAYSAYVKQYPTKMPESMEARFQLAALYGKKGDQKKRFYWLKDIVKVDKKMAASRTPRTRDIAASATLQLAEPARAAYKRVKLTQPLKKSLKNKKKLMQQAIQAYQKAIEFNVAAVTTAATYQVGELYHDFAKSLLKSQRPRGLKGEELEQYEILLEEQAFPFEEKAIDIHVTNVNRITDGIYDKWVKSSLTVLAKLQPVRYARQERSEEYLREIH